MFWVVPNERTFDAAVTSTIETKKYRCPSSAFTQCGSVKYRFDDEIKTNNVSTTSTSSDFSSSRTLPTLVQLVIAAFAAHDTRVSLRIEDERSLYAHAVRQIFIEKFKPSEPVVVEQTEDTAETFGDV